MLFFTSIAMGWGWDMTFIVSHWHLTSAFTIQHSSLSLPLGALLRYRLQKSSETLVLINILASWCLHSGKKVKNLFYTVIFYKYEQIDSISSIKNSLKVNQWNLLRTPGRKLAWRSIGGEQAAIFKQITGILKFSLN